MEAIQLGAMGSALALGAVLELELESVHSPLQPGDEIHINLQMQDLGGAAFGAAGFQAFLEFDPTALQFINGSYTDEPFGLPILGPIQSEAGQIDLARGLNVLDGQQPTFDDALLAVLTFEVLEPACQPDLGFRPNMPPTRISDQFSQPIEPLALIDPAPPECPADLTHDCIVNADDLFVLLGAWGPVGGSSDEADLTMDGVVNADDLFVLLGDWGDCVG